MTALEGLPWWRRLLLLGPAPNGENPDSATSTKVASVQARGISRHERSESDAHTVEIGDPPSAEARDARGAVGAVGVPEVTAEEVIRHLRERVIARWHAPDFAPARVMTAEQWQQLQPFLRSQPAGSKPVLYAMVRGQYVPAHALFEPSFTANVGGGVKAADILVEVFADGTTRRSGWRRRIQLTRQNLLLADQGEMFVADLGGVPRTPELVLTLRPRTSWPFSCGRVRAPEGSHAAEVIRALHLIKAGTDTHVIFDTDPPEVWPVPQQLRSTVATRLPEKPDRPEQPRPRMVRDAREAEEMVAEWMRWLGWPDASVTAPGADSGVDVSGDRVVAQVKFEAVKTGRPALQALYGAGHAVGAGDWVFVSSAGYTGQALQWADQVGMLLFRFTLDGALEPVNTAAERRFSA